jgi:RNA polymerase sigma factor (TIGR02999 family)
LRKPLEIAVMPAPEKWPGEEIASVDERRALDDLFSLIYEELRRLASFTRRNELSLTINSTAIVHEAWLKLKDSPHLASKPESHFRSIAVKAMRQVLVDEARRRSALKRTGITPAFAVVYGDSPEQIAGREEELLSLDAALNELENLNPRQARVIECRFFGGLSVHETAELLDVSESSVERDWRVVRAWLKSKISGNEESGDGKRTMGKDPDSL